MTDKLQRLELTWPGKEDRFNPEPRILLEDKEKSYSYPQDVGNSVLGKNQSLSSPLRGEDKGEGDKHSSTLDLLSFAKDMRKNPTEAEKTLWYALKNQQLGYKFRRQHQIGNYIVDFVCLEKKLIVECDGGQHNEEVDKERTDFLQKEGFKVIRFWNNEISENLEGVLIQINDELSSPSPLPSPLKGEGVKPTFDNMLIHGDNLLALKALEQDYAGKVKCIYIDPPYNTGNAFEHYDDGLEHSIWLSLMRDRLEILKRLLSDDGSIWISLDDNEQAYCKVLCDEIFGRQNFINNVIWQKKFSPQNDAKWLSDNHDFIMVYAKNKMVWRPNLLPRSEEMNARYKNPDNDPRGVWTSGDISVKRITLKDIYPIKTPSGREVMPPAGTSWRLSKETLEKMIQENRIWFGPNGDSVPRIKRFLSEVKDGMTALTIWPYTEVGHNQDAKKEVIAFNSEDVFATPKPERLIERVLTLASNPGDLVLDSFLGSGTTAAVAHKMGRRWIGVEMGDHVYTHCLPRLKKVINGEDLGGVTTSTGWLCGGGFKFYELASSLIVKDKYGQQIISDKYNADMLAEAMCKILGYHYKPDSTAYWKQGYSSEKSFIYTTTFSMQEASLERLHEEVGDNNLLVCCSAFSGNSKAYPNISVKKIPAAILKKCEWGREGYPLNLTNYHPDDKEFEFDEDESEDL